MMYLQGEGLVKDSGISIRASFNIDDAKIMQIIVGDYPPGSEYGNIADFQIDAPKLRIEDSKSKIANKSVHMNNDPLPAMDLIHHYTLRVQGSVYFSPAQPTTNTQLVQSLPTIPDNAIYAIIDIAIPTLPSKRLNVRKTKRWNPLHWKVGKTKRWNPLHWNWNQIGNGITILFVSMVLMIIVAFALLNSLGALSGSLTALAGFSGVVILAIPFLSISSLSKLVTDRWKLLSKKASLLLTVIIILMSLAFLVVPTLGYLGPSSCLSSSYLTSFYPTFPAFLAGSQYIAPQQLYQKIVGCRQNGDWSSLQTGKISTGWDGGKTNHNPNCVFSRNGYEVTAIEGGGPFGDGVQPCFFHTAAYGDFAYQVTMTVENQGN